MSLHTKTEQELLIELHNKIKSRIVETTVSITFLKLKIKKNKTDADKKLSYENAITINESNVADDKVYLKCVEEALENVGN